jgi:hypothetical protein
MDERAASREVTKLDSKVEMREPSCEVMEFANESSIAWRAGSTLITGVAVPEATGAAAGGGTCW